MKIVIETSVIGLAQLYETARTGIFRVISSLTEELLRRRQLDISFCSLSSIEVNRLTNIYLAERGLKESALAENIVERLFNGLAGDNLAQKRQQFRGKVLSKCHRISQTWRIGGSADIFHSMYSALPCFRGVRTPLRMMTIYDIIPLLHPEYFADGFVDQFRPIVESLSPDKDYVFTISERSKDDICSYFHMDPDRVFVAYPAASPEIYHPVEDKSYIDEVKNRFGIPAAPYFLTLATVEKRKNLETSLRCFRRILHEPGCQDVSFVLVGVRGWKVEDLIDQISSDPLLRRRVIFTGFAPDRYLSALYSGALAFLYPSLYEGFGLPPLEAMQCGLPVISSATSSLPEVVADAGILVDPMDKDAISQAMLSLLNAADTRQRLIAKGLERAKCFSWQRCADQTETGYRRAWDGR